MKNAISLAVIFVELILIGILFFNTHNLRKELADEMQNSKEISGQLNELRSSIAGGWKVEI